ncbi:hypothetical protein QOZ95_005157 [Paenibacillus brasilensis]|uniref:Uncharacterized protein n=1 Tax=Paenibacillus brasilensis TaxID=128574 RepID=A0ABU0L6Q7_9BACL|nr:hypothetical protein [Paenibacillus brasilensis]
MSVQCIGLLTTLPELDRACTERTVYDESVLLMMHPILRLDTVKEACQKIGKILCARALRIGVISQLTRRRIDCPALLIARRT